MRKKNKVTGVNKMRKQRKKLNKGKNSLDKNEMLKDKWEYRRKITTKRKEKS